MARLSYSQRKKMPKSTFALPSTREGGKGGYPIPDESHARNALARVSQHGSSSQKATVRAKVHAKFPGIEMSKGKMHTGGVIPKDGLYEMQEGEKVIPAHKSNEGTTAVSGICVPSSTEETRHPMLETVSSSPNRGFLVEAHPTVDAGHDSQTGHWEGDGDSVKFVKA